MSKPMAPSTEGDGNRPIHPDTDWQADLLAGKVLRRVMTLAAAAEELRSWQADAVAGSDRWRTVEPRALLVTHMLNRLLARGY